jgi:hypothetical protein
MDRLFLFAAPLTLIAYASLVARLVELAPVRVASGALAAATATIAIAVAPTHVDRIAHPVYFAVGKQIIADVDSMSRGEPVYVAARSFPLWIFYTTNWNAPDVDRLRWQPRSLGQGHRHTTMRLHGRVRDSIRPSCWRAATVGEPRSYACQRVGSIARLRDH